MNKFYSSWNWWVWAMVPSSEVSEAMFGYDHHPTVSHTLHPKEHLKVWLQSLVLTTRKHLEWQLFARKPKHEMGMTRDYWLDPRHACGEPIVYSCYSPLLLLHNCNFKMNLFLFILSQVHTSNHSACYYDFCTSETFLLVQFFHISITLTSTNRYNIMSWFQTHLHS